MHLSLTHTLSFSLSLSLSLSLTHTHTHTRTHTHTHNRTHAHTHTHNTHTSARNPNSVTNACEASKQADNAKEVDAQISAAEKRLTEAKARVERTVTATRTVTVKLASGATVEVPVDSSPSRPPASKSW